MTLPESDYLFRKITKSKKASTANLYKMKALRAVCDLTGVLKVKESCLDKELVLLLFDRIHNDIPVDVFFATSVLLDFYYPEWKQFASDSVKGAVLTRNSKEVSYWVNSVLERDSYTCVNCGSKKSLHSHHIIHWAESPALRINLENGITLCSQCHSKEHPELSVSLFNKNDK